jgi:radical SAM superfamily enzyme YgiQ (UPF0313 family)
MSRKIGFVAMSGVRAQNQELLEMGLTLPGFVERSKVIASLPSLGLLTLAGLTPPEYDVGYVDVADIAELSSLPGDFDLVAISSFSMQMKEAYELADRYRAAGVAVVLGGLHVSALPDEAAPHADAIVLGEGEPAWPQLLLDFDQGNLQPRYDVRDVDFDLADAPMPRFELLDAESYNRITVQTQRGCPHRCEFCAASTLLTRRYKVKPVPKVVAEIRRIKESWDSPFIEFADDNTFVDMRHSRELLRALIPEGVRWFTETDVSVADDPELLELMSESGCRQVLIGLESPTADGLEGLELKANWKRRQLERYRRAIDRIQDHRITVNGCFVMGLDGTDTQSFEDVFNFVRDSGLYEVQITIMTPFPGTPLYERLGREGRLLHEGEWERCTLFDVNYRPQHMSVAELEDGFRELGARLYSEEFTTARRRRFFARQRQLRASRTQPDESV